MGNGVALVPHLTVARELETRELVAVSVTELEMKRILRLLHRRQGTLSYAASAFLQSVRALARQNGPPFYYHVEKTGQREPGQQGRQGKDRPGTAIRNV
jgi:hypothetical protein